MLSEIDWRVFLIRNRTSVKMIDTEIEKAADPIKTPTTETLCWFSAMLFALRFGLTCVATKNNN